MVNPAAVGFCPVAASDFAAHATSIRAEKIRRNGKTHLRNTAFTLPSKDVQKQ